MLLVVLFFDSRVYVYLGIKGNIEVLEYTVLHAFFLSLDRVIVHPAGSTFVMA